MVRFVKVIRVDKVYMCAIDSVVCGGLDASGNRYSEASSGNA